MNFSLASFSIAICLYAVCLAPTVALLARIRTAALRKADGQGPVSTLVWFLAHASVITLSAIGVPALVFWLPQALEPHEPTGFDATGLANRAFAFMYAQVVWTAPSAMFHVAFAEAGLSRASIFRLIRRSLMVTLGVTLLSALPGLEHLCVPILRSCVQVVTGILPLSAALGAPSISIHVGGSGFDVDWMRYARPLQAAILGAAVGTAYAIHVMRMRPGRPERLAR